MMPEYTTPLGTVVTTGLYKLNPENGGPEAVPIWWCQVKPGPSANLPAPIEFGATGETEGEAMAHAIDRTGIHPDNI